MRFQSAVARKASSKREFDEFLDLLEGNFENLEQIIEQILELIRVEHDEQCQRFQFNINSLLAELIHTYSSEHPNLLVSAHPHKIKYAVGNKKLIRIAVQNALENALAYAKTEVQIHANHTDDEYRIDIQDDGPGIPAEDRELVLRPFSRLDKSRHKGTGGIGLGLALVNLIMDKHRGQIEIKDSDLGGTTISLCWPR
jgi:two-component system sensor histidine kinase RstB